MNQAYGGTPVSSSGQITYGFMIVAITFVVFLSIEMLYKVTTSASTRLVTLLDYTAGAEDMMITIRQDKNKYPEAIPVGMSVNERSGIEFAYSFYLYVLPSTFSAGTNSLRHVFHKGHVRPWPLMGPGVFIHGNTNAMRVVMNTYKNPYTYADIQNIPIQKWFHVVLNCSKGALDVFVNGHLASRVRFTDTLPYQNFGDIYMFSTANYMNVFNNIPSIGDNDTFNIEGAFKGYLSNLVYTRYALSVSEIQGLLNNGPSTKVKQKTMEKPPYLADDWWANQTA